MLKADPSSVDEDKFSEEDLKRFRVGGRLVTRKEVIRSRKCMYAVSVTGIGDLPSSF